MRTILHSDLNNFYASVECVKNPELSDKPIAVCGSRENRHGIVLAKNQIAKQYGVKTGWPLWKARSVCPGLVITAPNFPLYLDYSRRVRKIYCEYTNNVESFGIDECWLDVTESMRLFGDGSEIAYKIKERIKNEIGITCSVGVSYNKIFAKLGSDMKKPDAVTVLMPGDLETKIFPLPCEELIYIGRATKRKLNNISLYTIGDLANTSPVILESILGKWGRMLWNFSNGLDDSPVCPIDFEREVKSVGNSLTTPRDLMVENEAKMLLLVLSESVGQRLREHGLSGKTIQITIRNSNFETIERQGILEYYTNVTMEIYKAAVEIFISSWTWEKGIRMLGVRALDLIPSGEFIQLSLFMDKRHEKNKKIDECVDTIRRKFGDEKIARASTLKGNVAWSRYLESEGPSAFTLK